MYGKNVKVLLPYSGTEITIFMFCIPETPENELQERALKQIISECQTELFERNFAQQEVASERFQSLP